MSSHLGIGTVVDNKIKKNCVLIDYLYLPESST